MHPQPCKQDLVQPRRGCSLQPGGCLSPCQSCPDDLWHYPLLGQGQHRPRLEPLSVLPPRNQGVKADSMSGLAFSKGSLGKASLPRKSRREPQAPNLRSGGQVGVGPGTTWPVVEGRGCIAAARRGRCNSFLLLEEFPRVVRPLGNNGRCLLGAQRRGQGGPSGGEPCPPHVPSSQLSPLPPIRTSSSGSLPPRPVGHPGNPRDSVLGTPLPLSSWPSNRPHVFSTTWQEGAWRWHLCSLHHPVTELPLHLHCHSTALHLPE